jgi:hypothetical protein
MSAEAQPIQEPRFEYFVVEEFDPEAIGKRVEDLLNEGWKLQGNLVLAAYYAKDGENQAQRHRTIYAQALIKETHPEPKLPENLDLSVDKLRKVKIVP